MANLEVPSTGQMDVYFNGINTGPFRISERDDAVSCPMGDDLHYSSPRRIARRPNRVRQPP